MDRVQPSQQMVSAMRGHRMMIVTRLTVTIPVSTTHLDNQQKNHQSEARQTADETDLTESLILKTLR